MREIKFRAWDVNEDEYVPWERLIKLHYNQEYFHYFDGNAPSLNFMTDKYLIKEEYTGFIDNNGDEWYENDLILHDGVVYQLVWDKEELTWALMITVAFYSKHDFCDWYYYLSNISCVSNEWKKIGNVHENKNLLEV